jgi:pimeloyl-ACP methyl ester carboxylesterase
MRRTATLVLIHGAGDVGWYWHLVEGELRRRGHDVVAPDLPCDDDYAGLSESRGEQEWGTFADNPQSSVTDCGAAGSL